MIGETRDLFWGYKVTSTGLVFKPDGTLANQYLTNTGKKRDHPYYMVWIRAPWGYWGKYWVHRMVAFVFCPNPRPDIFDRVDHIDRDGTNNHKNNLRWINHALNMCNSYAQNTYDRINQNTTHTPCIPFPTRSHPKNDDLSSL